ncbi:replication initiator [Nocardia salmonicida]|uniref:replication initiator n=1 Tax=Nocardia salmonicida TaxID=53431 RepID=UPI0037A39768
MSDNTIGTASLGRPARQTAADRRAMPDLKDIAASAADKEDICTRLVPMRAVDSATGTVTYLGAPCKATDANKCPACAKAARSLRMTQLREGWTLDAEPIPETTEPTDEQRTLLADRARYFNDYHAARDDGDDELAEAIRDLVAELDADLRELGVRGRFPTLDEKPRRKAKSTRRRQDAPDLPRLRVEKNTVGRLYGGKYRPSTFLTLTMPSYGKINTTGAKTKDGKVCGDGSPRDPETYDYTRAARDIVHFAALFDRWVQNLRRAVGWDVQYFATVEPQKRGAPHLHMAIRGSISRKTFEQVTAATYRQIWWPHHDREVYRDDKMPVWDYDAGTFVDPRTRRPLTGWNEALDVMDTVDDLDPAHVIRFGAQIDPQAVLAGTDKCENKVRYLTKYLTKSIADVLDTDSRRTAVHYDRLHAELQHTPCSPRCGVWLRYGIVPKGASDKTVPGQCKGKAHRRDTLGLPGRRVLVSKKWTGKTLPDHRADRVEFVRQSLAAAGIVKPDTSHLRITPVRPGDKDAPPIEHLIMTAVVARINNRAQYTTARLVQAESPPGDQQEARNTVVPQHISINQQSAA